MEAIVNGRLVIYAAYVLIGFASYLLARMLVQEQESRAAQENLEDLRARAASTWLVRATRPFFTQYVVPMVRGKNFWDVQRRKYGRKLVSSGLKEELTPDEFIAFKVVLIAFFPILGGLLKALDLIDLSLMIVILSGVGGWFYPDLWINARIEFRRKQILKALPFVVDLLALSTEAGLDFVGAISKVVEKSVPNPLVDELEQVLKEMRLGSNRADALREMANRVDMPEIGSFVAILISADQMGASIGKILRQQSEQIRGERFLRAEKEGAKAAPKLILVTVLMILPAVILIILGPYAIFYVSPPGGPQ